MQSDSGNPWLKGERNDDLTRLFGINNEISDLLSSSGLDNFAKLTQASVANLRSILENAGPEFEFVNPDTWPEQAIYASQGNWELHERWKSSVHDSSDGIEFAEELELLEQASSLLTRSSAFTDYENVDELDLDLEKFSDDHIRMTESIFLLKANGLF